MMRKCIGCGFVKFFEYEGCEIEGEYGCGHPGKALGKCPKEDQNV